MKFGIEVDSKRPCTYCVWNIVSK